MNTRTFSFYTANRWWLALILALTLLGVRPAQATPQIAPPALQNAAASEPEADWLAAVQQDIQRREYHVTWSEQTNLPDLPAAYQSPNRAHNLRTYFSEGGLRIIPRQVEAGQPLPWELGMRLSAYGRPGAMQAVGMALSSAAQGERFSYQYPGLEEWVFNRPEGLEHGFSLAERPAGQGWLALEIILSGSLSAHLLEDGQAIEFSSPGGVTVLRYDQLYAYDATGRELPARLALSAGPPSAISILVDDDVAQYPLTIDPLATTPGWDQASARFGYSVATAGDVNGDGYADVIVGAPYYDNGESDEGLAFVYYGSSTGLSAAPAWTAESDQASANFGFSVATAGDVNGDGYADVIVGAPYYNNDQTDEGRAYVYHGSASGLSAAPAWTAEIDQASAYFGYSVATAGDVNGDGYADVIIGAPYYDNGESDEGRAFVYHGSASGLSAATAWKAESNQASAYFSWSVVTAGDVNGDGFADVIVGAPYFDNGQDNEGRAFVYYGSAAGLSGTPAWTAESNQAYAYFGWSVATAGDINGDGYADVIVGAPFFDNGQTDEGRAFVYHGSSAGLSAAPAWTAESDQAGAFFGWSVATAGDINGDGYADVIVGAPFFDNGQTDEGRAFVNHGSSAGLSRRPAWTVESDQAGARFGSSVAAAGDVNGDGYADVIVGAPGYDITLADEGCAFVFYGSAAGLSTTPDWMARGNWFNAKFGISAATAGDVNGDGYADVIVGAHHYNDAFENKFGRAFVYHGSASGLSIAPAWTVVSDQANANFGFSVATAGDVNGDGYADVIVGAYGYNSVVIAEGRAFVYHGSPSGLSAAPAWTAQSDQAFAFFGYSVAAAGDVNGDGYTDVIVGAPYYDNDQTDEGRAFVYYGSSAGLSAAPAWTAERDQADARFGWSVAAAGDVNGDGYADVIVGAYGYDNDQTDEGRAFVYHGSSAGLSATAAWTAESDQAGANFGWSVATAGDVNGDGYADVIVGAHWYDNGESDEGRAYVFYGNSDNGLSLRPQARRSDNSAAIQPGGKSDSSNSFRLAALGRTPFGRGMVKLEWEVKPLGVAFDGAGLAQSTNWIDTGTAGAELNELVGELATNTVYHWRVRLRYHPATTPFQQSSRWFTQPWNGWNESDLRLIGERYETFLPIILTNAGSLSQAHQPQSSSSPVAGATRHPPPGAVHLACATHFRSRQDVMKT